MDHDDIAALRSRSAAWRLLRADTAPMVLAVLGRIFVVDNARTLPEGELLDRVDDLIYAINAGLPTDGEKPAYPRSPREYVDAWAHPDAGWLRKFYPEGSDEAHYDATSDLEKAWAWVSGLQARAFIGTESRLHTVVELLRQMVHGAQDDPGARMAELYRRRAELDDEIARAEGEGVPALDAAALLDRYQHFAGTARELLADFREVEDNFRALDRAAREQIAGWEGSKGQLLDQLVGDRHAISASEQGRSFQAFHDFLLSHRRQEELNGLLDQLLHIPQVPVDRRLRHIHYDWLDAAERTQQTVRQLSEQLRRFLDDQAWLENRRVVDLLRSIERTALAVRSADPRTTGVEPPQMEIDDVAPQVRLPMERPLYAPATDGLAPPELTAEPDDVDASGLFDQVYVDTARIADTLRDSLRRRSQVDLATHLSEHPPTLGLAEIIAHLAVTEEDIEIVTDESVHVDIPYEDVEGMPRSVRLAQVTYCRPTTTIAVAGATGRRTGGAERRTVTTARRAGGAERRTGSAGGQTLTTEGPP